VPLGCEKQARVPRFQENRGGEESDAYYEGRRGQAVVWGGGIQECCLRSPGGPRLKAMQTIKGLDEKKKIRKKKKPREPVVKEKGRKGGTVAYQGEVARGQRSEPGLIGEPSWRRKMSARLPGYLKGGGRGRYR